MKKAKYILLIIIILINFNCVYAETLELSSKSSILMDGDTGRVLYNKNGYEKMPIASTTKIMTALIALEKGNIEDKIRVSNDSIGIEGSSIYLKPGEIITLKDLIYGLMLRSGNDAAVAIAIHISGSVEEFVQAMNDKASSIGALNTNFINPNGLHHDNHYSTAYDMALIAREAFKYEEFREIVSSKSYSSNRSENGYFYNKNKTLWDYDGGNGIKTGYTMRSGRCLVSSASKNGMNLISVSLNAGDWFNDNYKLLDYGFDNYKPLLIYDKGQFIKKIKLNNFNDKDINLVTEDLLFYPLKKEEKERIKISIEVPDNIELPISQGDGIGSIYVYLDNKLINKKRLVSKNDIDKDNLIKRLFNKVKSN